MREIRLMHVYLNRQVFRQLLVGMVAMFVVTSVSAQSPRRVALLIGNAAYEAEKPLRNPINDVNAIATVLRNDLGFSDVKVITNARRRELVAAVERFGEAARGADAALFYFSGHGQQQGKSNYLLPVDAKIETPAHVKSEGLDADDVQAALESASPRVSLLILDACRNNPFSTRTRSSAKGLTRPRNPEEGTLIAFATRDGDVADDGAGNNSPYAQALVNGLKQANRVPIQQMFDEISDSVKRQTENKQRPTKFGDLKVNIFLVEPISGSANAGRGQSLPAPPTEPSGSAIRPSVSPNGSAEPPDVEIEFWNSIKDSKEVRPFMKYLVQYPQGRYASAARQKGNITLTVEGCYVRGDGTGLSWSGRCVDRLADGDGVLKVQSKNGEILWRGQMRGGVASGKWRVDFSGVSDTKVTSRTAYFDEAGEPMADAEIEFKDGGNYRGKTDATRSKLLGDPHGSGVMRFADGASYDGDFLRGAREGIGVLRFPASHASLDRYQGGFVANSFDGMGTMYLRNGGRYVGKFSKGMRNGAGIQYDANGKVVFDGEFNMDQVVVNRVAEQNAKQQQANHEQECLRRTGSPRYSASRDAQGNTSVNCLGPEPTSRPTTSQSGLFPYGSNVSCPQVYVGNGMARCQ